MRGDTKLPMKLLAALCDAKLPFQIVEADDIEKLAVLKSTGFVDAEIPPMLVEGDGWRYAAPAVVEKVTESGYAACMMRGQRALPLAEAMKPETEVNYIERDNWQVSVRIARLANDGLLWGSGDIAYEGGCKCRLALAHGFKTREELIDAFEAKAGKWIEGWLARSQSSMNSVNN
jgi:hypothetical protein